MLPCVGVSRDTSERERIFIRKIAIGFRGSQNQPEHRNNTDKSPKYQPGVNCKMSDSYFAPFPFHRFRLHNRLLWFDVDAHAAAASRFRASFANFLGLFSATSSNISVLKITSRAPIRLGTSNISDRADASPKFPLSNAKE